MEPQEGEVLDPQQPDQEVSPQSTDAPSVGGVTPQQPVMPSAEPSDAPNLAQENEELKAQIAALEKSKERDLTRLRSSLDRQRAQEQETWQSRIKEAENRFNDLLASSMDDEDRIQFELERAQQVNKELQSELENARRKAEETKMMAQYQQMFSTLGIDQSKLDYSDMASLSESGWMAIFDLVEELRGQADSAPASPTAPQTPTTPQTPSAPNVMHQHGAQVVGPKTPTALVEELKKQFGPDFTEDDISRYIRMGKLDQSILESLDPDLLY